MTKTQNFEENELANYIFDSLFNEDTYEIFPDLEDCYDDNPSAMVSIFMNFYEELCDISKPIAKPLLNERSTYIYRKVYGLYNDGFFQSRHSVGEELDLTGARVGQLVKQCNLVLINSFIRDYYSRLKDSVTDDVPIEELGFTQGVYLKLKRLGINYLNEIDIDSLSETKSFGEKTIAVIANSVSRVRK